LCGKCATRGENFGNFCLSGNLACGIYAVQDDSYAEILLLNRFFFSEVIVRLRRRNAEVGKRKQKFFQESFCAENALRAVKTSATFA
jgi:hypothetical protein